MYECMNVCACVCVCIIYEQDFLFSSLYKYILFVLYIEYIFNCAETIISSCAIKAGEKIL